MTERKGRTLERLVELLERVLGGLELKVTSPDWIPDRDTGEPREVDVSVRGRLGGSDILVILEARDRQSKQDVTWIEQLAEKAKSVGADKVVAVSSSGFFEPAIKKASARGILLRSIDDLTRDNIAGWFNAPGITVSGVCYEIKAVQIGLSDVPEGVSLDALIPLIRCPQHVPCEYLLRESDKRPTSLAHICSGIPQDHPFYQGIPEDGSRVLRHITISLAACQDRYHVIDGECRYLVAEIHMSMELWQATTVIPPKAIRGYKTAGVGDGDATLAQLVEFDLIHGDSRAQASIVRDARTGRVVLSVLPLPDGDRAQRSDKSPETTDRSLQANEPDS